MTRTRVNGRSGFDGRGVRKQGRGLAALVLVGAGTLLLGGCYVVPVGYPVAGPAYMAPVVVAPAPVYVAPGPPYGYGWGWRRYGRW
jgi:hypothetical protein